MLRDWAIVEADFYREYGILLINEIRDLNWRLFITLLNGLSVNSRWANLIQNADTIIDDELAEKILDGFGERTGGTTRKDRN